MLHTAALALRQALCRRSSSASSGLHWTAAAAAAAAASSSSFWQRSGGSSSSLVVAAQPQGQQQQQQGKNSVRSIFTDAAERRRKQGEEAAEAAAKEAKERADAEDRSEDEAASKLAASRSAMAAARGDINVLGGALELCGTDPITGFTREGCCTTGPQDIGSHTVCSVLTEAFLSFSRSRGNDLVTPRPEYRFPGLKPGDRWCLCASRWQEALESGMAPKVVLAATHRKALDACSLDDLIAHAVDPPAGTTDRAEVGSWVPCVCVFGGGDARIGSYLDVRLSIRLTKYRLHHSLIHRRAAPRRSSEHAAVVCFGGGGRAELIRLAD